MDGAREGPHGPSGAPPLAVAKGQISPGRSLQMSEKIIFVKVGSTTMRAFKSGGGTFEGLRFQNYGSSDRGTASTLSTL